MRRFLWSITLTMVVLLGVPAAMDSPGSSVAEAKKRRKYSFRRHIQPTFNRYCIRCHRNTKKKKAPLGLDLRKRYSYKNLVDVQSKQAQEGYNRVTSGEAVLSYLVYKLQGKHKHPNVKGKGARMPKGKRPIPGWRIDRIIYWIQQGAKKN